MNYFRRIYAFCKYDRAMFKLARVGKYLLAQHPDDTDANVLVLNQLANMLDGRDAL